jgi:hypothetical protein
MKNPYPKLSKAMGLEWSYGIDGKPVSYLPPSGSVRIYSEGQRWVLFGYVWEWATAQEWWEDFLSIPMNGVLFTIGGIKTTGRHMNSDLIHPTRFLDAVEKFLDGQDIL